MSEKTVSIVLLNEHPELLQQCCDLLNKQWKRSVSARCHSLEKNASNLPNSLLLVKEEHGVTKVIGHSRLSRTIEDLHGCWITSVLIDEEHRGKGLGKYVMLKSEDYAKQLGFGTAYLSTHDQQGFYEHLGYIYCDGVSGIAGFSWNNKVKENDMANLQHNKLPPFLPESRSQKYESNSCDKFAPTLPPPPPTLKNESRTNLNYNNNFIQQFMKKKLI